MSRSVKLLPSGRMAGSISLMSYPSNPPGKLLGDPRLKDVITKIEPRLFQKVTGLTTADFERLVSLGVFNSQLMNDAVWKFRRYEDASLRYMGVERHRPLELGLWDTALTEADFQETFESLAG